MSHAFVDSGERKPAKDGRMLRVCAECGRTNIGTAHRLTTMPVPRPVSKARKPVMAREVKLMALAVEAVLDLPMDQVGFSVWVRALDLRKAIPLPFDQQSRPLDETERKPKPQPIVISDLPVERLSGPVRARASVAAKDIRDGKMREIAVRAVATGWTLDKTGSDHFLLRNGRERIVMPKTTGDRRAWQNVRATAKRHGIDVRDI